LVNCLNHYLDVEPGQIFWGDHDISQMSRQDLRSFVTTMTQEAYLFSDTIEKNVRFGSDELAQPISDEQVQQVLQLSQLSEDIRAFGDKEQTIVGEKGIMLSGGQKQRLSIARALLTPGDLIIMDNVLSAVDYETERKILNSVFEHIKDKSLLVVSHRISALENMDEILVLEQGEIIARGSHAELLASSDYYRRTWALQQQDAQSKEQEASL
ncbi:MAG: ABC transporter ATP-binding protein, partial [Algicola sp.]|nr:ABC transporter ATP-binding protein [Algicola sp.]